MPKFFCLSSAGLKNIIINNKEHDFEFRFLFGQREIKTNTFFAEFISPMISHLHQCDPTITSINIEDIINNRSKKTIPIHQFITDHSISQLEQMMQGSSIDINEEDQKSLRIISIILGNEELFQKINQLNPQFITNKPLEELIDELIIYNELSTTEFEYSVIIDRLSRDFSKINKKRFGSLPKSVIYSIIKNENFDYKCEDELFDLIKEMQENDQISLFEEIDFTKLSSAKFREFIELFDYREMTGKIWTNLCECFYFNHVPSLKEREFKFDGNDQNRLKGIIHQLTKEAGGNVSDQGIVDITSSSISSFQNSYPKNAVDFDDIQSFYASQNDKYDQWIQFDFKERKIVPTHYSIRTRSDNDNCNPQNWCIEVSNTKNDNDWKVIDSRSNVLSIQKKNQIATFDINQQFSPNECYRYIRLRQTGKSTGNFNYLIISALEFFGKLIETNFM